MTPENYNRARELFLEGLELDAPRRVELLDRECGEDAELRDHVAQLWSNDDTGTALPERLDVRAAAERLEVDWAGETVGPYRIIERVGEGGMGSVYKAVDDALERETALKFLAPHLLGDPNLRERFAREAKTAAVLDHPNICAVYGTGEFRGYPYIAMAFLRGRTLEQRIAEGALAVDEAVDVIRQAARGLAAAHDRGVVHRDVKPSNIMITTGPEGGRLVQIMDFGIARMEDATRLTLTSAAMGTTSYMAPEQTFGEEVDGRADVWALGVALHEALTGTRPFRGADASETIQAIRKQKPPKPSSLRPELPSELDRIVARALAKKPERRYPNLREMERDLRAAVEPNGPSDAAAQPVATGRSIRWPLVAGVAAAALLAVVFFRRQTPPPPPEPLVSRPLTSDPGREWSPSLSPDGRTLAYAAAPLGQPFDSDLFLQLLSGGAPLRLAPTPRAEFSPTWSPDGSQTAFLRSDASDIRQIYVVSSLGGVDRLVGEILAPSPREIWRPPPHLDWSPDGALLAVVDRETAAHPFHVAALNLATGEKTQLTFPDENVIGDFAPRYSPDGKRIAFARYRSNEIATVMLGEFGDDGRLLEPLVEVRAGAQPLNASPAWTPDGSEILFAAGTGRLAHLWGAPLPGLRPRLLARTDHRLSSLTVAENEADGEWVLGYVARSRLEDVARVPLRIVSGRPVAVEGAEPQVLFGSSYNDTEPAVSPDGERVAFISNRSGSDQLLVGHVEGGAVEHLTSFSEAGLTHPRWSPDGETLALAVQENATSNVYLVHAGGLGPRPFLVSDSIDDRPEWSADGQWLYFRSNRGVGRQLWRAPVDGGEPELVIEKGIDAAVETDGRLFGASRGLGEISNGVFKKLAGSNVYRVQATGGGILTRGADDWVRYYDVRRESLEPVYKLPPDADVGVSISPDQQWLYFSLPRQPRIDVMVAENLKESLR